MCSLAGRRSTGDIGYPFYSLIDDESLGVVISFDLDVPLVPCCDDRGVKSKLLLV